MTAPPPTVAYLRSLQAVRDRSSLVYGLALSSSLDHWTFHPDRLSSAVDYCSAIISRDFGTSYSSIPPHCRRNHFTTGSINRISSLLAHPAFPTDKEERAARLLDLYLVSVLLDAGAGNEWSYTEKETGWVGGRSEGLAVASYNMFVAGVFSSDPTNKFQVDGELSH
ncbi:hypothetical protein P7C73_g6700, partial [Tremellales sp. Uapishka_1]